MVWSKLNKFSPLLSEAAISCSLTAVAALALEWLKPGLISNFLDLNLVLLVTIILALGAALAGSRQALIGWTRWYYGIGTMVVGSLMLKVVLRLLQLASVWWLIASAVLSLSILGLLIITGRKKHV